MLLKKGKICFYFKKNISTYAFKKQQMNQTQIVLFCK